MLVKQANKLENARKWIVNTLSKEEDLPHLQAKVEKERADEDTSADWGEPSDPASIDGVSSISGIPAPIGPTKEAAIAGMIGRGALTAAKYLGKGAGKGLAAAASGAGKGAVATGKGALRAQKGVQGFFNRGGVRGSIGRVGQRAGFKNQTMKDWAAHSHKRTRAGLAADTAQTGAMEAYNINAMKNTNL